MRKVFAPFVLALLVLLPAACTTTPETPREKLAAAEVTYQTVVETILEANSAGLLDDATKQSLRTAIVSARAALDAWHQHPDLSDSQSAALSALRALRTLVRQFALEETS